MMFSSIRLSCILQLEKRWDLCHIPLAQHHFQTLFYMGSKASGKIYVCITMKNNYYSQCYDITSRKSVPRGQRQGCTGVR